MIDLKDCFFKIPLDPTDAPRFAFSVPSINRGAPMRRYHWRVLPQGMKNSPTTCQQYLTRILSPVRKLSAQSIILHYMDEILICARTQNYLDWTLNKLINTLQNEGFEIQEEKVQKVSPWKYLGLLISDRIIVPQPLRINDNPKNLRDLQQLCGSINWVRPMLGLTTEDLAPLFNLLKGSEDLNAPHSLTPVVRGSIRKVQEALSSKQVHRYHPELSFQFAVLGTLPYLHGLMFQWDDGQRDPLLINEWVFLPYQSSKSITMPQEHMAKLIMRARSCLRTLAACDFTCIYLPLTKETLQFLIEINTNLQYALDSYPGQISIHYPKHKLFSAAFKLIPKTKQSPKPLNALTIFTDGSGKSNKSVITWKDPKTRRWESDIQRVQGSPQIVELAAIVRAFERFKEPFDLTSDLAYVVGVVSRADQATLKQLKNPQIDAILSKLIHLISHREHLFFIMHVRSHTDLPGFIAEGNQMADRLAMSVRNVTLPDIFQQAKLSCALLHQNVPALAKMFHLTREQARAIVATCPSCQKQQLPSLGPGVNPCGLGSCEIWQMDVTHVPSFGRQKYVHISVDTFSDATFASAHAGEKAKDVINHLLQAFSVLGIPRELKMDNRPVYISL